jgi:hypothetical protein
MSKKIVPIDYTGNDFDSIKKNLINYAKKYYPNTSKDFNEASFGALMTDLVSYVGDSLSFYLDYNANESFLATSLEYENVVMHANQMGYKHSTTRSSVGKIDLYIPIPANTTYSAPDTNYLPRIRAGASFSTPGGNIFTLIEDVNFLSQDSEYVGDELSADGSKIAYYIVKKSARVISGENRQTTMEVGDFQRFLKLKIPASNISEVVSVVDTNGNEYYEVDYLSQNVVYRPVVNRDASTQTGSAQSIVKPFPVPRRFVVERNGRNVFLVFGYGSESEIKKEKVADPSEIVLDILGKNYVSNVTFDPSKLLTTEKFGVSPINTSLTVTYRINTEQNVNAAVGSVTTVVNPNIEFSNPQNLEAAKMQYIIRNMESFNEEPINGDISVPTTEEIKKRAYASFATQGRAVTLQDYVSATYAMPVNFGSVKRASIHRDDNDLTRNMNMYIISEGPLGKLERSSSVLKQNLKTWLNSVKMVNDSVDILDATVLNLGIEFDVVGQKNVSTNQVFNAAKTELFDQLTVISPEIGEPFQITEIFRILKEVPEILDVVNIKVVNRAGSTYTNYSIDIDNYMSTEGRTLYVPKDVIWELKYESDITGTVR